MKPLIELLRSLGSIYEYNSKPKQKYYNICMDFGYRTDKIIKITCYAYIIIEIGATLPAIAALIFTGETLLSMHSNVFGVREDGIIAFAYNIFVSSFNTYIGGLTDVLIFYTFGTYPMVSHIIQKELEDFEVEMETKKMDCNEMNEAMGRVVFLYQKYIE